MTPEERAKAVIGAMIIRHFDEHGDLIISPVSSDGFAIIAQAIRQAEASARNEALEEAAKVCDGFVSILLPPVASNAIRNLKTKD